MVARRMSEGDDERPEFDLPRRFGRYVLFDHIGRGGMAEIYLARGTTQMGASRLAVVKLVLNRFAEDPAFATMLVSEAKLAARLSHRNVVQTFDLGREEDRLYIAMEYVEGYDLTKLLRRLAAKKIGLPAEYGFLVAMETLRALDYAHRSADEQGHALGIVHRDVSPSNILISLEGEVKLCDFGIARAVMDLTELPEGALEGKAAYMSPEQARGERIDARADVFSAAIILWELLAGRRMYRARDGKDALTLAREGAVPPLPDRGLPEQKALEAIVMKGLAPDREQRYATAGLMLRDLEDYALKARMMASPIRFGSFLSEQFEHEIVSERRGREQAALSVVAPVPVEVIPDLARDDDALVAPPQVSSVPVASPRRTPAPSPAPSYVPDGSVPTSLDDPSIPPHPTLPKFPPNQLPAQLRAKPPETLDAPAPPVVSVAVPTPLTQPDNAVAAPMPKRSPGLMVAAALAVLALVAAVFFAAR
ncbi:MAG: protein kinase [Polyangiales bacterium]